MLYDEIMKYKINNLEIMDNTSLSENVSKTINLSLLKMF